jgi:hypothetical protein
MGGRWDEKKTAKQAVFLFYIPPVPKNTTLLEIRIGLVYCTFVNYKHPLKK